MALILLQTPSPKRVGLGTGVPDTGLRIIRPLRLPVEVIRHRLLEEPVADMVLPVSIECAGGPNLGHGADPLQVGTCVYGERAFRIARPHIRDADGVVPRGERSAPGGTRYVEVHIDTP